MAVPTFRAPLIAADPLAINAELLADWLVRFLRAECKGRIGVERAVLGLSGGIDSAVVAFLCARAFGPERVHALRMPYRASSPDSLAHAQLVIEALGVHAHTIDITGMVDGYAAGQGGLDARRLGNVCARARMIVLFDQAQALGAIPIGTGNKTERLFGYFTWHADDSPPVNPLGDLYKSQVRQLARHLGVPEVICEKPPTADLVKGQTDEGDFGIDYPTADAILCRLVEGYSEEQVAALGFAPASVARVASLLNSTHWKRRLPSTAMVSASAIGEGFLRPLDYRAPRRG